MFIVEPFWPLEIATSASERAPRAKELAPLLFGRWLEICEKWDESLGACDETRRLDFFEGSEFVS